MDMRLTEQQQAIDESVRQVCAGFDDSYWTECEENSRFPIEYYDAMAKHGWLGITMPEEVVGRGTYSQLTPEVKNKIFGENAARIFGIDIAAARHAIEGDLLYKLREDGNPLPALAPL